MELIYNKEKRLFMKDEKNPELVCVTEKDENLGCYTDCGPSYPCSPDDCEPDNI